MCQSFAHISLHVAMIYRTENRILSFYEKWFFLVRILRLFCYFVGHIKINYKFSPAKFFQKMDAPVILYTHAYWQGILPGLRSGAVISTFTAFFLKRTESSKPGIDTLSAFLIPSTSISFFHFVVITY